MASLLCAEGTVYPSESIGLAQEKRRFIMRKLGVFLVALLLLTGATVWADNYNPPPWYDAYNDSMTVQGWEFGVTNNTNTPLPDWGKNVYGFQAATVTPGGTTGAGGWIDHLDGRNGVWGLSGEIEVPIYNDPILRPEKIVWVQITWQEQEQGGTPFVEGVPIPGFDTNLAVLVDQQPADGSWIYSTYEYHIFPNPEEEIVHISGDIFVDELVIHTWCVPEPVTMVTLVLGGIGILRRRRMA